MKTILSRYLIICFLLIAGSTVAQDNKLAIVAHEIGAPSALNNSDLKKIFRGEKQWWKDGTKIVIAFMKTSTPTGTEASKNILGMSGDELNKHWLSLVFQGKAKAPVFFSSEKELIDFVNQNKGAIGIVHKSAAGSARIISIEQAPSL